MPVGVPKVPYPDEDEEEEEKKKKKREEQEKRKAEGEEGEEEEEEEEEEPEPEWLDLFHRLYLERVLFLCRDLEDEIANQIIGVMLFINESEREKNDKDFFLYINSPGGSVICGIGIFDIMNYIESDVNTICVGIASSMASFVLTGGTYGKRVAFPNARMMIHQPEGGSEGQSTEVIFESVEVGRIRRDVEKIYSARTGQSVKRIIEDMGRDQFMSAEEAKAYGLVDKISFNRMTKQGVVLDQFNNLTYLNNINTYRD